MKKLLLFIAMLCSWGSVHGATEYDLGTVPTGNCPYDLYGNNTNVMLQFGENAYFIAGNDLYDTEKNLISTGGYSFPSNIGPSSAYDCILGYNILSRIQTTSKIIYLIEIIVSYSGTGGGQITHLFYVDSNLIIKLIGVGGLNISGSFNIPWNITNEYVKYGSSVFDFSTLSSYTGSLTLNTINTNKVLLTVSEGNRTQIIYYGYDEKFYMSENIRLSPGIYGTSTNEIFDGDLIGSELERLELNQKTGWLKGILRITQNGSIRNYTLSGCKSGSGFVFETSTGSTIYSNNATFQGGTNNVIFDAVDLKYWNFLNNGIILKGLNNDVIIDYGGNCTQNYGFGDFIENSPGRIFVVKNNRLYVNVLSAEDYVIVTGEIGSSSGGGGTSIPGTIGYEDPFETCNGEPSFFQFLGCIAEWISYIFGKLISFFEAITDFINKILDLFTEEERSLTSYIFGIEQANAGGDYNRLLPERPADYEESFMGKFDGMIMGIVYFLLVIITLVVILVMVKK